MSFQKRRKWMGLFDIERLNFRPIRYFVEIHNNNCPICLERMSIFTSIKRLRRYRGCGVCTFWAHTQCTEGFTSCPQCRSQF